MNLRAEAKNSKYPRRLGFIVPVLVHTFPFLCLSYLTTTKKQGKGWSVVFGMGPLNLLERGICKVATMQEVKDPLDHLGRSECVWRSKSVNQVTSTVSPNHFFYGAKTLKNFSPKNNSPPPPQRENSTKGKLKELEDKYTSLPLPPKTEGHGLG